MCPGLPVFLRIAYPKTLRSRPVPNWKRFDIEKTLPHFLALPIDPSPRDPEKLVTTTLNSPRATLCRSVPLRKSSCWPKPWSEDLSSLRADFHAAARHRRSSHSPGLLPEH